MTAAPGAIGDERDFERLLAPVIADAHRLATGLLHDSALAEDAVQDAAVNAWRHRATFHPGSPFRPWFLAIVANQCRDQHRRRARFPLLVGLSPRGGGATAGPEETAVSRATVRAALRRLGYRDQLLLVLRFYLDLPWSEVAEIAGMNEATVRSRVHRSLRRLRLPTGLGEVPA